VSRQIVFFDNECYLFRMSSDLYLDKALWEQIERLRSLMGPEQAEVGEMVAEQPSVAVVHSSPKMSAEEEEDLEAKKARLASILNASKDQWSEFFGAYSGAEEKMIDVSPISTANENLPDHVVFDHDRELYICELCDIKAPSLTIMERHVGGKEHTRRLSYLTSEVVEEELPPHVVWDKSIQYYKCTLCEAKGATMEILTRHLIGKEHTRRLSYLQPAESGEKLPDHVIWDAQSQYFVCTLCEAKAATLYIMEGHLMGTKHLKKIEYEAEIVAAKTQLPPHIEFNEPSQFYICTLCDAKAATMYLMESHLGGKEHQRRLGYGEASWGVSVATPAAVPEGGEAPVEEAEKKPMPEHVVWDNIIQYYVCTLCDAKAATEFIMEGHLTGDKHKKKLANIEWYRQNQPSGTDDATEMDDGSLPPYCVYDEKSQMYICKWCNKKSSCSELLTNHLRGKEHAKTCSNLGIPAYGENGHLSTSKEYVDKYGFDIWARQEHWPLDTILDAGMHWKCVLCMKKFATPGSVNDHLPCVETYDQPREPVAPPPKRREIKMTEYKPAKIYVPPPVQDEHKCYLCGSIWPSQDDLWFHEQKDPVHQELVKMAIGLLPKPVPAKPPPVLDPRLEFFEI